jgi:hypothetical protein
LAAISHGERPRIGGQLVKGLQRVVIGILLLGLAHLTEFLLPMLLNVTPFLNEIIHGLLEGSALILLVVGLARMRVAFDA